MISPVCKKSLGLNLSLPLSEWFPTLDQMNSQMRLKCKTWEKLLSIFPQVLFWPSKSMKLESDSPICKDESLRAPLSATRNQVASSFAQKMKT